MAITKETKDLADALFIQSMAVAYGKFAEKMPSGTELAELSLNLAIEYNKYWEDVEIIDEEPEGGGRSALLDIQENLELYLPSGNPPTNEKELVDLFKLMSKDYFGFSKCVIQNSFPNCFATTEDGEQLRIELEFNSVDFSLHHHNHDECDAIVCWAHNWSSVPDGIEIFELRRLFGFGFNVWFQGASGQYAEIIDEVDSSDEWSVASRASEGDLLLFYRTKPQSFMADIFMVDGPVERFDEAGWKEGKDWAAPIRRVCRLENPLLWKTLKSDDRLKDSPFVKMQMQGRLCASAYWGVLLELIVAKNPDLAWLQDSYGPHKIGQVA